MVEIITRSNLCPNPSADVSAAPWQVAGGVTVARDSTWSVFGTSSLKCTSSSLSSTSGDMRRGSSSALVDGITAGKQYTLSASLYLPAAHTTVDNSATSRQRRLLSAYSMDGVNATFLRSPTMAAPQANRLSLTFTVPEGAVGCIYAICCAGSATDAAYVTYAGGIMLQEGSTLGAFFDGYTPTYAADGGTYRTYWTGAPGASSSYETFEPDPGNSALSGLTNADLEMAFLRKMTQVTRPATLVDLRREFYSGNLSGVGSLSDAERAFWAKRL